MDDQVTEGIRLAVRALKALQEENQLIRLALDSSAAESMLMALDLAAIQAMQAWQELRRHRDFNES
jgi:hypothetical protein